MTLVQEAKARSHLRGEYAQGRDEKDMDGKNTGGNDDESQHG